MSGVHRPRTDQYRRVEAVMRGLKDHYPIKTLVLYHPKLVVKGKSEPVTYDDWKYNVRHNVGNFRNSSSAVLQLLETFWFVRPLEYYGDRDFNNTSVQAAALIYMKGEIEDQACAYRAEIGKPLSSKEPVFPEYVSMKEDGGRYLLAGNCASCAMSSRPCSLRSDREIWQPPKFGATSRNAPARRPSDSEAGRREPVVEVPSTPARQSGRETRSSMQKQKSSRSLKDSSGRVKTERKRRDPKIGTPYSIEKRTRPEVIDLDNGDRAAYTPDPDPNSVVAGEVALEDEGGMVAAFSLRRADQPKFYTKKDAVTFFRDMANAIASGSSVPSSLSCHTYRSPEVQYGRPESVERQDTPTRGPSQRPRPGSQTYPPMIQAPFATPVMGHQGPGAGPAPAQSPRYSQQQRYETQQQSSGQQPDVLVCFPLPFS
ncbi:hypothetical protein LTR93_011204 [Exophiala xenobiotica]|nr:hypothetical protein LTR93_011204 [Exophiala xenobiotica]